MIEQKRLSQPTQSFLRVHLGFPQLHALLLSALVAFASMALSSAALTDFRQIVFTLIAVTLLTSGAMVARRRGNPLSGYTMSGTAVNAGLLSLALCAWSVFLLMVLNSWQAAASAALALPFLAALSWLGGYQEVGGRLLLYSCLVALPAIVGGAAAAATVEMPGLILFAILFFWSLTYSRVSHLRDRHTDNTGGLPATAADAAAPRRLLFYSLQLVIISMLPTLLLPLTRGGSAAGVVYPVVAICLGIMVVSSASRLARAADQAHLRRMSDILSIYPFLLVLALIADRMLQ